MAGLRYIERERKRLFLPHELCTPLDRMLQSFKQQLHRKKGFESELPVERKAECCLILIDKDLFALLVIGYSTYRIKKSC